MRKLFIILALLFGYFSMQGQRIQSAEYYFGNDPGVGNATGLTITMGDTLNDNFSVPINSLSDGFNNISVRVKDSIGIWSQTHTKIFYKLPLSAATATPPVMRMEYFVDVDPGLGNATIIDFSTVGDSVYQVFSIPVASYGNGFHTIAVRVQDSDGIWSITENKIFYKLPLSSANTIPRIMRMEYFVDTDPGLGNATAINFSSVGDSVYQIFSVPVASFGEGFHNLAVRVQDSIGIWSITENKIFYVMSSISSTPSSKIVALEYFFDTDPGVGNGTSVSITEGDTINQAFTAGVSGMTPGLHYFCARVKDSLNTWSVIKSDTFRISSCQQPIASFAASDICFGDTIFLANNSSNTDALVKYEWDINNDGTYDFTAVGDTFIIPTTISNLDIKLRTTNSHTFIYNCPDSVTNTIAINPLPATPSIWAFGPTTFCDGDSVTLQANAVAITDYQWIKDGNIINNDTLFQHKAFSSGLYSVIVTDNKTCSSTSADVQVTALNSPTSSFALNNDGCTYDTVTVSYSGNAAANANYTWSFANANIISGSGQGPYKLLYTSIAMEFVSLIVDENNCVSNTNTDSINIQSFASIASSYTQNICDGDSIIIHANTNPNYSYQWYEHSNMINGANQAEYAANNTGLYKVFISDISTGCSSYSNGLQINVHTTNFGIAFTANTTSFTQPPFNVTFTNQTPNMGNYQFDWDLGDGSTSTFYNPGHNYAYNGNYSINLYAEDASTGCRDTLSVVDYISCNGGAPNPCTILAAISPAGPITICGGDSVMLSANAGTGYTYQWVYNNTLITDEDSIVFYAKNPGDYRVVVSDAICSQTSSAFTLNQYPSMIPIIQATGSIQPCTNDSMNLNLLVGYNTYSWNTGSTSPSIYVNQTGYYQLDVTDNYGCNMTSAPYVVSNSFLNPPELCIVGVDDNNHNQLVWERQTSSLIDSFYVYRESFIAGQYDKIGAIPFIQSSVFVDANSNPAIKAYRYKIAAVDTCGGITLLGNYHKTIHLTINAGLNGSWNLIWDGYEGFAFGSYRIYRGTNTNSMSLLTQLASTANSYTDLSPPTGTVYYQIEVIKTTGCFPDTVTTKVNTNYNSSRSNTANNANMNPVFLNANFDGDIQTGVWPIQIEFNDLSTGGPDSWLWNFGDGNSSSDQNPSHMYNNTGLYTVSLIACNGTICDTTIKTDYIDVLPNGIVEVGVDISTQLYPNPNDGNFTLEINDKGNHKLQVHIYNTLGAEVYSERFQSSGNTLKNLKLSQLANGVYYVHLNTKDKVVYRSKIVIEK